MKRSITAFLILSIIFLVGCEPEKPLTPEEQALSGERAMQSDAYYTAKQFVKEHLAFPESAKFQPYSAYYDYSPGDVLVTNCGNGLYSVSGEVTAKNAYGMELKQRFGCRVQLTGERWSLVKMTFFEDR